MQAANRWLIALALCAVLASKVSAAEKAPSKEGDTSPAKIGQKVDNITFKDIRYLPRTLADFGDRKAYVLVFTTLECPVVLRYLPKLKELEAAYRDQGVQFVAVNVGLNDDLREIAYQAIRTESEFPFVKDFGGVVARAVGAERASEVVVLDADKKLRYRGRIDDQFRLGGEKAKATKEDLKEALDAVLAGREVTVAQTAVDGCKISFPKTQKRDQAVTYAEHVAPLLQKHCQDCHHDGNPEAPFALMTYDEAAAHAPMIAETVEEQRMPPWYASKDHGHFTNFRGLSSDERALIIDWVRGDCQQGDMSKAPAPRVFAETKWKIGEPDVVIKTAVQKIPATGLVDYRYLTLPYSFKQDTWVQGVQILPENAKVMHHCNMLFITASSLSGGAKSAAQNFITGQVPGGDAMALDNNVAFKIPKGATLLLQVHYVTVGEATTDQISVGLRFAREVVQKNLRNTQVANLTFAIPPGAPHHEVKAVREFKNPITGYGLFSHMHLRGEDMTFRAIYPDGHDETLLVVPNYNFNWQQAYRWGQDKQKFPAGTKLEVVAHYDNSVFNPYNPDPKDTVKEGQQTHQEMMYGFVFYTEDNENLNLKIDPKTGHVIPDADQSASK